VGLYNVVQPCCVNGLHYVNPTSQPIQVDDEQAASLVEAGSLTPYGSPLALVNEASSLNPDERAWAGALLEQSQPDIESPTDTEGSAEASEETSESPQRSRGRRKPRPEDAA